MRLLADTHIGLWALTDDRRLSGPARALIGDPGNSVHLSVASIWEIAIKATVSANRKGRLPVTAREALELFRAAGYAILDVRAEHACAVADLPLIHADPFDRLLIAQAVTEPMKLVTHDKTLAAYGDAVLVV